jgi:hypothetical protein
VLPPCAMELKFRVIQSNDRGLITKQGDRTYARRGPAKGIEALELPTLFIWVSGKDRYLARCWTQWSGEKLGNDFIYVVSRFRDVIDLHGDTWYHQCCSKQLSSQLWTLERPTLERHREQYVPNLRTAGRVWPITGKLRLRNWREARSGRDGGRNAPAH